MLITEEEIKQIQEALNEWKKCKLKIGDCVIYPNLFYNADEGPFGKGIVTNIYNENGDNLGLSVEVKHQDDDIVVKPISHVFHDMDLGWNEATDYYVNYIKNKIETQFAKYNSIEDFNADLINNWRGGLCSFTKDELRLIAMRFKGEIDYKKILLNR